MLSKGTWRMHWQWAGLGSLVVLLALAMLFFGAFPRLLAWTLHQAPMGRPPAELSAQAQALHSKLLVVDLQAATLMWRRDLIARGTSGHVDLARLTDGNVALQVFGVASRLEWPGSDPPGDRFDLLTPLAIAQGWPIQAWHDAGARALHQAEDLRRILLTAGSRIIGVRTKADLDRLLLARTQARENGLPPPVGALLALRDTGALDGDPARLETFFEAGFRMAVPPVSATLPRTAAAAADRPPGTAADARPGARSVYVQAARRWLEPMEQLGMVVDVQGLAPAELEAVLAAARRPIVASHAGLRGACDRPGNLDDAQARGIAGTGGLIAIAFTADAVCDATLDGIVRSIRYAVDLVGVEHVALGSDFDAARPTTIDAAGLAHLTQALAAAGFSDEDIIHIAGANAWQLMRSLLPE